MKMSNSIPNEMAILKIVNFDLSHYGVAEDVKSKGSGKWPSGHLSKGFFEEYNYYGPMILKFIQKFNIIL